MSLEDFIVGTIAKTLFSPITTVISIIDAVIDEPEENRMNTFLKNEPGVDLSPNIFKDPFQNPRK